MPTNISTFDSTPLTYLTKQWKRRQLELKYSLFIRTIGRNPQNGQLLLELRGEIMSEDLEGILCRGKA